MIEPEAYRPAIPDIENGNIDVDRFDHEAHVFAAWQFVRAMPLTEAINRFSDALRRLTERLGVPEKYHDTITWFYLLKISEHCKAEQNWSDFRATHAELFDPNLIRRYYTEECLESAEARTNFVLPDRVAA